MQELNRSVVISEEYANNASGKVKSGGLMFNRKVSRIITPGTLIDEKFINPYESNFLLAVSTTSQDISPMLQEVQAELALDSTGPLRKLGDVGLAWLDLSTGVFYTQMTAGASLASTIARIGPKEIVLDTSCKTAVEIEFLGASAQHYQVVTRHPTENINLPMSQWTSMLERSVSPESEKFFSELEVAAGNILLDYVRQKLQDSGIKLQPPIRKRDNETMSIDKTSLRGLEILETAKDGISGGKGSLLHTVRRTVTQGGTRMLKDWIGKRTCSSFSACVSGLNNELMTMTLCGRAHYHFLVPEGCFVTFKRAEKVIQKVVYASRKSLGAVEIEVCRCILCFANIENSISVNVTYDY